MARQLRIEYPGAVYHVTSRGNARNAIYADDEDRRTFLKVLHSVVGRFNWRCHAYCLLNNHYHLMIETPKANLSKGMRQLNGVYTQLYNRRHGLGGHVFQGRFKAIIVDKENYLLQLCRYLVQNPVALHLVETPEAWPWSSYRATAGLAAVPEWLTVDWILGQFSRELTEARQAYREFVAGGTTGASPWTALVGQIFLGGEGFAEQLAPQLTDRKQLTEIPKRQRYASRPSLDGMLAPRQRMDRSEKDAKIYQAHAFYGYTLKEIGDFLGLHYATVSRAVKRAEANLSRRES